MRIGILGARGSGKSDLCDGLYENLPGPKSMVDGYVENFERKTQLATGQYATYLVSMQIAMWRLDHELEEEREIKTDGGNLEEGNGVLITAGTLIDTTIYLALHAAAMANTGQGSLDINLMNDLRSNATMHWFGMMRVDCWKYDHVFYLPLGDRRDEDKDRVAAVFDDHVVEACESYQVPFIKLDQSTPEERLAKALEIINGG